MKVAKTCCCTLVVLLCVAVQGTAAEPIPAFIMGQNVEHTCSAVQGGLSAQLVRNRKFAGRPRRNGVAHTFRAVVCTLHEEDTPVVLRVSSGRTWEDRSG